MSSFGLKSLSHVRLFVTPWIIACQAPLSMGFSRQGYWSGLTFPSPGDLPNPGIEPMSPALEVKSLPLSHQGSPIIYWVTVVVGWHHRLHGHEFEQAPGVGDRQGSLACYSPWGCKVLDNTEPVNWTELNWSLYIQSTKRRPGKLKHTEQRIDHIVK